MTIRRYEGRLLYKCRRCDGIDDGTHSPDVMLRISEMRLYGTVRTIEGISTSLLGFHCCDDGHFGVTDLIGAELDTPIKGERK